MILRNISLLIVLIFAQIGFSQSNPDIDSLEMAYSQMAMDTSKIRVANTLSNYYMYRTPQTAKMYVEDIISLSETLDYEIGSSMGNYQMGVFYNNLDQLDSAAYFYNRSLGIAKKIDASDYISRVLHGLAIVNYAQGKLQAADSLNQLDLELCERMGDTLGVALAYDMKGTINQNMGYFSIALTNVLKGLKTMETTGDSIRIADSYNHLAILEHNLKNYDQAIHYNQLALSIYEAYDDVLYQAQALNDIGVMYMLKEEYGIALDYFNRSLEKSKNINSKNLEVASLTNVGSTFIDQRKFQKADSVLKEALILAQEVNAQRRAAILYNHLADLHLRISEPKKAIDYAALARTLATENKYLAIEHISLKHLSEGHKKLGNYSEALYLFEGFKTLSDSILSQEKVNKIEELRIQFETEKKENEIALQGKEINALNAKAKSDRLSKLLYGIGFFSFLSIAGLLFVTNRQRIKKKELAMAKQKELHEQKLQYKQKELASQTLHLVQKNAFIEEMEESIKKVQGSKEDFKKEFRRLLLLLKRQKAEEKDWEVFKNYFSQVHNDFDVKLKKEAPDISEKEIRLASFLRMNLSTKEIASMLNVLPETVLKAKYRLKKKLPLEKDDDLMQYLGTF